MTTPNRDSPAPKPSMSFEPLMDALDEASQLSLSHKPVSRSRNRDRRITYRQQLAASIEHPGGGMVKLSVSSRNLSAGGIGLLCNVFIHPGSTCSLILLTAEGEQVAVQGRVAHCHLVRGRTHEIGVKFLRPISLSSFVAAESMPQNEVSPVELQGHVLLLDASSLELMLFKHCINETKIALTAHREVPAAIEALTGTNKKEHFDIFVCDMFLAGPGPEGIAVVKQVRDAGFSGPIIMTTPEFDEAQNTTARAAGASYFIVKPYKPGALLVVLQRAHEDCGVMVRAELLASTLPDQLAIPDLQQAFQEEIGAHSQGIQQALDAGDMARLRRECLAVKAAATGMGYMNLAAAVDTAINAIVGRPFPVARAGLLRVASACRALARAA